jgi:hypoxanthine phosphoribosyltransferase
MEYPTHPSYDQIHEGCLAFAQTYTAPDFIIGLLRGGMINAITLSHIYGDVPVLAADYSSKKGAGDNVRSHKNNLPRLPLGHHKILIVDDICDSGYTLAEVVRAYESQNNIVDCYVSYLKENDVFWRTDHTWKIPKDAPWIVMPWEDI